LLNRSLAVSRLAWHTRPYGRLWNYHLHYFDYGADLGWAYREAHDPACAERFARIAEDWLAHNPVGTGDGWDPFPTSVRIANWVLARVLFGSALEPAVAARIDASLLLQTEWLRHNMEYHLLGNHLLKNVRGLAWAGAWCGGRQAGVWRRDAFRMLKREIAAQFDVDGVHEERSPMYHALALADVLEAAGVLGVHGHVLPDILQRRLARGLQFARAMTRPDGSLHLFNDSADRVAPGVPYLTRLVADVLERAQPSGSPAAPAGFVAGGFHFFRDERDTVIVDGGAPGPAHQPGHAHCGLLGYTMDVAGEPVIVDTGVHGYENDRFRSYCRSTAAHNTVRIEGGEQSEVWATFRMARRATLLRSESSAESRAYTGACAPYHRPDCRHEREIVRLGLGNWRITDRVLNADGARVESFLHLHPRFEVERDADGFVARAPGCTVVIEPFGFDRIDLVRGAEDPLQGWYLPEFGRAEASATLVMNAVARPMEATGYFVKVKAAEPQ
jgi:hypothetical protein